MPSGAPASSATSPTLTAASPAAAALPVPISPMIRPRDVDGYIAPQNRVWSGTVNEIETQYRTAASTATRGWPTSASATSESAPITRRTANCFVVRGPTRPAKALRRFAMNGAVASAAMPSGTRPPCRAIAGSSAPTTALVIRCPPRLPGRATGSDARRPDRSDDDRSRSTRLGRTPHTSHHSRGLRGQLSGGPGGIRRASALAGGPRFAPGRRFPALIEVRPGHRVSALATVSRAWEERHGSSS